MSALRSHINAFKQQAPRILQAHGPASAEWGQFMAAFWAASGVPITFALAQIPEAVTDWMRRKASFAMADGNGAQPRRDPLQGQGSARR